MRLVGGTPTRVTSNGGFASAESQDGRALFFAKRNVAGLWKISLPSGAREQPVVEGLRTEDWANWIVSDAGIYFIESFSSSEPRRLSFYGFQNGRVELGFSASKIPYASGLALTPDATSLFFTQVDRSESDLMKLDIEP